MLESRFSVSFILILHHGSVLLFRIYCPARGVFAARWNTLRPFAGTPVLSSHDSLAWGRMKEKGGGKL